VLGRSALLPGSATLAFGVGAVAAVLAAVTASALYGRLARPASGEALARSGPT